MELLSIGALGAGVLSAVCYSFAQGGPRAIRSPRCNLCVLGVLCVVCVGGGVHRIIRFQVF